jgi:PIN domain nuclease of toxin-antitoxin system
MKLPLPGEHRDPFDHLLLAQAAAEGAQFVTADARLAGFGVALLPAA